MFDPDNAFLVETFEQLVSNLPASMLDEARQNGSYYNFHIKTDNEIIVPRQINFVFKYLHLVKQHSPDYWEKVVRSWNSILTPTFGDPLDPDRRSCLISTFDAVYDNDHYGIMPAVVDKNDDFTVFENIENKVDDVELSMSSALKFMQLYNNTAEHQWNPDTKVYVFPANNVMFYGLLDGKLKLVYPVWDAFRWSFEYPKFICDTRHLTKIIKFKPFNIDNEQESIRRMNGSPDKQLFR